MGARRQLDSPNRSRHTPLVLLGGLSRVAFFGGMVACSSSSNPATSDASASDGNGGSDGALIDAVPVDGLNADVPLGFDCDPNAPLGLVTVHTGAGVAVIANDVNGEYVGRTVANNAGIATIMVPGCGSVTAARPAALYALVSNVSAR